MNYSTDEMIKIAEVATNQRVIANALAQAIVLGKDDIAIILLDRLQQIMGSQDPVRAWDRIMMEYGVLK